MLGLVTSGVVTHAGVELCKVIFGDVSSGKVRKIN